MWQLFACVLRHAAPQPMVWKVWTPSMLRPLPAPRRRPLEEAKLATLRALRPDLCRDTALRVLELERGLYQQECTCKSVQVGGGLISHFGSVLTKC